MRTILGELSEIVAGRVDTDPDVMVAYSRDQCLTAPAGAPLAVVHPTSTAEVSQVLRLATRHRLPVVTRGAGSGLAGGANAIDGCIVLSLDAMNRAPLIDAVARTATVEAGVLNADLDAAARRHGLFYAPDPGSRSISTIGGNLATNAGGMCCTKYGVTADHALCLTAVLADGTVMTTGRATLKDVAGLDLVRLLVGSEGTLAVITEAVVRLRPEPDGVSTMAAFFATPHEAIEVVQALTDIGPACVEIMDRTTIAAVNDMTHMGLDPDAGALLLVQCDGRGADRAAADCVAVMQRGGARDVAITHDPAEGAAFMRARASAYPALEQRGSTMLDDVCVPVHALPRMLSLVDQVGADHELTIGTFGHAADGNLHPTIVYDAASPAELQRATEAFDAIVRGALALGGTISGEHGIGALKTGHLGDQLAHAERDVMQRVRSALDPAGILNPGRAY
ncbi:FAD-linked oxidase C-terminal domain-containing protein [Aeromicrobium sp. NPDC092404]|uniref:FAD-binding oxidoreductase n=1 Tax=Aeromicrobium sp. NPDC092404 TaxID=3154976 RepID=UPI0034453A30